MPPIQNYQTAAKLKTFFTSGTTSTARAAAAWPGAIGHGHCCHSCWPPSPQDLQQRGTILQQIHTMKNGPACEAPADRNSVAMPVHHQRQGHEHLLLMGLPTARRYCRRAYAAHRHEHQLQIDLWWSLLHPWPWRIAIVAEKKPAARTVKLHTDTRWRKSPAAFILAGGRTSGRTLRRR